MPNPPPNRRVAVLAYDGLCSFEFGITVEIFGLNRPHHDDWYDFIVCASSDEPLLAAGGIEVRAPGSLADLARAGTVVIPGWKESREAPSPEIVGALRTAYDSGARIVSICSGVFVLADTGLLDGRRATTHWRYSDELRRRFPEIDVTADVLFVDEGDVLTSAGSSAGIDLALHIVRNDYGAAHSNDVARRLVVPPRREGDQAQFRPPPSDPAAEQFWSDRLQQLRDDLAAPHTVEAMAAHFRTSSRTLARQFKERLGLTPGRWLARERVFEAQRLLESSDLTAESIARHVGFSSAQLLRLHFRRTLKTSPSRYRKTFRKGLKATG